MRLTEEQILSALKGAPAARVDAGRVVPERFTDLQRAGYPAHWPRYFRTFCHPGTLDFYTDADAVTLGYANVWNGSPDCPSFFFDVLENDVLTAHWGWDIPKGAVKRVPDGAVTIPLSPGEKRVTVYLTGFFHMEITLVELVNGSTFRPYEPKGRFLAFGDSITEGFHAVHPSETYANLLARALDREIVNYSVGGEVNRPGVVVPGTYPDCEFVLVSYGTNDFGHTEPETFARDLPAFHRRMHEAFDRTPVIVLLPALRKIAEKEKPLGTLRDVSARIAESASAYPNFHVVDCIDMIPHDPEMFFDHTLHPNDEGMGHLARGLEPEIRKIMGW